MKDSIIFRSLKDSNYPLKDELLKYREDGFNAACAEWDVCPLDVVKYLMDNNFIPKTNKAELDKICDFVLQYHLQKTPFHEGIQLYEDYQKNIDPASIKGLCNTYGKAYVVIKVLDDCDLIRRLCNFGKMITFGGTFALFLQNALPLDRDIDDIDLIIPTDKASLEENLMKTLRIHGHKLGFTRVNDTHYNNAFYHKIHIGTREVTVNWIFLKDDEKSYEYAMRTTYLQYNKHKNKDYGINATSVADILAIKATWGREKDIKDIHDITEMLTR